MTKEELDELVASVTPERLQALALTVESTYPLGKRTAVPVGGLVRALTAGVDLAEGPEEQQVTARLAEAIRATVQQMPEAEYVEGH